MQNNSGIINVLKPPGMTSHDVIAVLRKSLGIKRIGHAGTLDPAAAGVLPVFVGQATRLIEYISNVDKSYRAEITIGYSTDTGDDTGIITAEAPHISLDRTKLNAILATFVGAILQVPPMYSAVKIKGQKLYDLARAGVNIERPPREITIHSIELVDILEDKFVIDVTCSKGTYIRTLCEDIGKALGTLACMTFLVRTRVGSFRLDDAVTIEEIHSLGTAVFRPMDEAVLDFPLEVLQEDLIKDFENGKKIPYNGNIRGLGRIYNGQQQFIGLAQFTNLIKPVKVFKSLN